MRLIHVGVACLNQVPLGWDVNLAHIRDAITAARSAGVSLLCLPELALTGYGCEDTFFMRDVQDRAFNMLNEVAPLTQGMVACVGLPVYHEKALYNCAALLADGELVGLAAKQFLAGDGIHYEPRWFKPYPAGDADVLERGAKRYPIGDLLFDLGGIRIGFEICEDAWVANRPGVDLALRGADVLCNPSASHFAFGKFAVRQRFVVEGSRAFGVAYLYANLLGNEAGRVIYDGGGLIASGGELVARGERFSFDSFDLATAVVDIDGNRREQARRGGHRPRHDAESLVVSRPFAWPSVAPVAPPVIPVTWEDGIRNDLPHIRHEEMTRALAIALWDYLRKSGAQGYVVSMSGGADSAACAVFVALAVAAALHELGPGGMLAALPRVPRLRDAIEAGADRAGLVNALLACAYQPTSNSGTVTRDAAERVSTAIGAEFLVIDVGQQVERYVANTERAIGRKLEWQRDDVTLQNIQARARAPSIWMLANVREAVLLTTSNRSEAAVGYATMDGDTAGGLAPLGGIDKLYLREWLRWMETTGPSWYGPLPALAAITAQQPTAELRPPSAAQTDETDLMPYDVLEAIEDCAIRDKFAPLEVLHALMPRYAQYRPHQLATWIERFFKLWCRNQWKRERIAPSFHLDDRNVDPRSWCRFPILSGGFERELAELRAYVARS